MMHLTEEFKKDFLLRTRLRSRTAKAILVINEAEKLFAPQIEAIKSELRSLVLRQLQEEEEAL